MPGGALPGTGAVRAVVCASRAPPVPESAVRAPEPEFAVPARAGAAGSAGQASSARASARPPASTSMRPDLVILGPIAGLTREFSGHRKDEHTRMPARRQYKAV